jgi:hypothetical protein
MAQMNLIVNYDKNSVWPGKVRPTPIKGTVKEDRNGPCPCGSGQKAKKCQKCKGDTFGICQPAHHLNEEGYHRRVEEILTQRHSNLSHLPESRHEMVRSYCRDGVISPEFCCDLLEKLTEHEKESNVFSS